MYKRISLVVLMLFSMLFSSYGGSGITYMSKEGLDRIIPYAKRANKPILIYFHSQHCFTSKRFTREIMSEDTVRKFLGQRYFCIDGDVAFPTGNKLATSYSVLSLPLLILLAPDGKHPFECEMTFELEDIFNQTGKYVSSCSILMQAELLKSTSKLTENEALYKIGASYAKVDFLKRRDIHPRENCKRFLVNVSKLSHFKDGYMEEWAKLEEEEKKKEAEKDK